jgi:hypothetical protein
MSPNAHNVLLALGFTNMTTLDESPSMHPLQAAVLLCCLHLMLWYHVVSKRVAGRCWQQASVFPQGASGWLWMVWQVLPE